jgi:hypothetical protein
MQRSESHSFFVKKQNEKTFAMRRRCAGVLGLQRVTKAV